MSQWSKEFHQESHYKLPDGRDFAIRLTLNDHIDDAGHTDYRRVVNREIIGDVTDQEALEIAKQLRWIGRNDRLTIIDAINPPATPA